MLVIKAFAAQCLNDEFFGGVGICVCILFDFSTLVSRARVDCNLLIDDKDDFVVEFATGMSFLVNFIFCASCIVL